MSLPDLRSHLTPPAPTQEAWTTLARNLSAALCVLEEDEALHLAAKRSVGSVRFTARGRHGLLAETVGNYALRPEDKLNDDQLAMLAELGWGPPTVDEPSPEWVESDPDFHPSYYLEIGAPVPWDAVVELALTTLRQVHRVQHPRELWYDAWGRGNVIKLPTLGLRMMPPPPPAA